MSWGVGGGGGLKTKGSFEGTILFHDGNKRTEGKGKITPMGEESHVVQSRPNHSQRAVKSDQLSEAPEPVQ